MRWSRCGLSLVALAIVASCGTSAAHRSVATPAVLFPRLEGVYRQGSHAYVVTFQGWWLDMTSQAIRQLQPSGDGEYQYGPMWMVPSPIEGQLHFRTSKSGQVDRVTGIAPGGIRIDAARWPTVSRDVTFPSGDATIAGTLTVPPGPGPHPGVVIVQGSGPLDRHFESISNGIYTSMGLAVLSYDKRGTGASTGTYPGERATPASIAIQAADAGAAARFLIGHPEVDPHQVGFDANSQGGWVAPLASQRVPGLGFEVLISAPAVTSDQQSVYAGFSGGSAYVPTESDATIDAHVRATTDCTDNSTCYDPEPALRVLNVATLWIYGQLDRQVPVRVSVGNLGAFHNPNWTVDVLPGAGHGTVETKDGLDSEATRTTRFAGTYFADVRGWLAKRVTLAPMA